MSRAAQHTDMPCGSHTERTSPKTRPPRLLAPSLLLLLLAFVFVHAPHSPALAQAQRRPAPRLFGETQAYEWNVLERFARYLKRRPRERGHVIVYTSRKTTYSAPDAGARIKMVQESLFESLGIKPGRVSMVDGGLREQATVELWVLPRGASPPEPRPTSPREALLVCPHFYADSETFMLNLKEPLTFSAVLHDGDPALRPSFRWSVSHGKILSGQGEQKIKVGEVGEGSKVVTATVEVGGLPAGCDNRGTVETSVGFVPFKWDEYGNIRIGDEKARLDHFAIELQEEPELVAYVLVYGGRVGRRNEAQNRADRAVNYLTNTRGVEPERVRAVDGGLRESLHVELWLSTRGAPAPVPVPTVAPRPAPRSPRRGPRQ